MGGCGPPDRASASRSCLAGSAAARVDRCSCRSRCAERRSVGATVITVLRERRCFLDADRHLPEGFRELTRDDVTVVTVFPIPWKGRQGTAGARPRPSPIVRELDAPLQQLREASGRTTQHAIPAHLSRFLDHGDTPDRGMRIERTSSGRVFWRQRPSADAKHSIGPRAQGSSPNPPKSTADSDPGGQMREPTQRRAGGTRGGSGHPRTTA